MRSWLIIAAFLVTACRSDLLVTQRFDDWTGFHETFTQDYEILRNSQAIMTARGIVISKNGEREFAVLTNLRRLGPNGPLIRYVSSGGVHLDYRRHDRLLTQCASRCRRAETGAIILSQTAFEIASRTGLPIRIQGRRGRYEAMIPAQLFQHTLNAL